MTRRTRSLACVAALAVACAAHSPAPEPGDPAAEARAVVEELAGLEPPRSAQHPESMARAARAIAARFALLGLGPRLETYEVGGETYANVHAQIGTGARERVVVGAHYDVFGEAPGADDNASGVAALLAVAGLLADRPLDADVELVAYALEERPHSHTDAMGSMRHARALKAAGVRVRAMLSLEMLGYYDDAAGSQEYETPALRERFGDRGNFLAVVGREEELELLATIEAPMRAASDLPVALLAAPPGTRGIDRSDHRSFWTHGFPALLLTDTAELRNPNYHQPTDLPGTLDYARLVKAARAAAAAIEVLAGPGAP